MPVRITAVQETTNRLAFQRNNATQAPYKLMKREQSTGQTFETAQLVRA